MHYQESLLWIPAAAFLSVFFVNLIGQRYRRGLSSLAVLFVSQALLTKNLGYIIVLLALADTFLGVELFLSSKVDEKNRAVQSLYQSALSLLPTALGLMLRLDGNSLISCVAVTIVLRLYSWPVSHWLVEISGDNKMFPTYIGIVSSFALWHIQEFLQPELWALVWLSLAFLFGLGSKYTEMYATFSLGLFALSPVLGIASVCLWPLLARPTYTIYLVAAFSAVSGGLLAQSLSGYLAPEATYAFVSLVGAALARVFVATAIVKARWYMVALDLFFAALWIGFLFYTNTLPIPIPTPAGVTFVDSFVFVFLLGKLLYKKKPGFFKPFPGFPPHLFSKEIIGSDLLLERKGASVEMGQSPFRVLIFEALESEGYIAILFGLLGAVLLWGAK